MTLFDNMVADLQAKGAKEENALHEAMQQIALAGLSRGGFFDRAAFYGGTCLHLLHGLDRYSEDMDFSLLEPDLKFRFEDYFPAVVEEFKLAGKDVEIKLKHKGQPTAIESAFLKESSEVFDVGFTTEKRIKVKIEVDIDPPPKFATEMLTYASPRLFWLRAYTLPDLFAGKMSAALFRKWARRVKGRDWYDLMWYIAKGVPLDLSHLIERAREAAPSVDVSTTEKLLMALDARIDTIDFDSAADDVRPYLDDPTEVAHWSRDTFHQLARRMVVEAAV